MTGRISMYEPNLQNVPKDYVLEDEILSIRSAFVSKPGQFYLYYYLNGTPFKNNQIVLKHLIY